MQIGFKDFKRFEKQIILKNVGIAGQKKILNAKILIIGIGGLGCPLLTYLAASGVGTIGIVDPDKVEISNLNRQMLFTTSDIGKYKVDQAKSSINRINNKIRIKTYKEKVTIKNIKSIIKDFDIICDGTDNFETRYTVNDECKKMKKILVSAAISKFDGHLYKFNFKKKIPCYRCFMPEKPKIEKNCDTEGIFSPVAGILGSLQANEVLKTILNFKDSLNSEIIIFESIKYNFRKVKLSPNPNCKNKC
ncbi:MAG: HesA/MoeB/ThiF family protein [Pseudomonadota bacterium]|nr:HesA/MoeB/ThiF family protein [Pseudomonadota bacterium]